MTGYAFSRYEQFETYPETIEQELRPGGNKPCSDALYKGKSCFGINNSIILSE